MQGYYRFPAIYKNTIVFTAEGDLWKVDAHGGQAHRLTSHHGEETRARISPDGRYIAFSAQYEGFTEVYCMDFDGSHPTRLTYESEEALVVNWTPDGRILYSTRHFSTLPNTQLAQIRPDQLESELLPLSQASDGCFDPTGQTLFFTRLAFQGSHTKRYKGGTAQNIWRFTIGDKEALPLTADYPGTSKTPLWWNDRLYFATDRDGTMNIWSMTPSGQELKQHTFYKGWDVKSPGLHEGRLVYQLGADIYLYDIANDKTDLVPITLSSDLDQMRLKWIKNPFSYLTAIHLSPNGDKLALTSRGRVFVAPAEQGRLIDLTPKPGVRCRSAHFLPDNQRVMYLSDESGELEFWTAPANGLGSAQQITSDGKVFRFDGVPSPDGKWLAYADKNEQLWLLNLEDRQQQRLTEENAGRDISYLRWAPDSNWLAYAMRAKNQHWQIWIYSLKDKKSTAITTERVDSYAPSWSPDCKWIFFLSDRHFDSQVGSPWGARQPEPFMDRTGKVYLVALTKLQRSPFQPDDEIYLALQQSKDKDKNNNRPAEEKKPEPAEEPAPPQEEKREEETPPADNQPDEKPAEKPVEPPAPATNDKAAGNGGAKPADAKADDKNPPKPEVIIDFDGINERVYEAPLPPRNYSALSVVEKRLFWLETQHDDGKRSLVTLKIDNKEVNAETLLTDVRSYEISQDRKKILIYKDSDFYVLDIGSKPEAKDAPDVSAKNLGKRKVNLRGWMFHVVPRAEWRQMLTEAWRLERDYFYDPTLHGVDWRVLLERHLPLIDRVTDRAELDDLISQLVSELAALHTYVGGGDIRPIPDRIPIGSLGGRLRRDASGGFRIDRIYRSDPDYFEVRSPLDRPDLPVKEGDIIEEINGVAVQNMPHESLLLRNQVGQQVLLKIKPAAGGDAFSIVVNPISIGAEINLRYDDWELNCRKYVENAGKGQIGYVHLRAMGKENYAEWVRNFFPVFDRLGLIVDVRHNRGGNIDSWILSRLMRKAWHYWQPRVGEPYWNMQYAFRGHIVVLCDERTASDGEAFSEGFRRLGLGKVIGARTWGGEIWLSFNNPLVDRGFASAAQIGVYSPEREWIIEGHGVEPDIVVDNPPHATFLGKDAQLERAIRHLNQLIKRKPVSVPPPPAYPDKSFKYA